MSLFKKKPSLLKQKTTPNKKQLNFVQQCIKKKLHEKNEDLSIIYYVELAIFIRYKNTFSSFNNTSKKEIKTFIIEYIDTFF